MKLFAIEEDQLDTLKAVAKRLFSENHMNGNEMRNLAQSIFSITTFSEALGPIPEPSLE